MTILFNGAKVGFRSCGHRPQKFLLDSQCYGYVRGTTGSTGGIHSPRWRQDMIGSERKNGDRLLFGDTDEKGSSTEGFPVQATEKNHTALLGLLDSKHTTRVLLETTTRNPSHTLPGLASLPSFPFFLELVWRNKTLTEENGKLGSMENATSRGLKVECAPPHPRVPWVHPINFKPLHQTQGVAIHYVFSPWPSGPKQPSSGTRVRISSALLDKACELAPLESEV